MSTGAVFVMLFFVTVLWGGFAFVLSVAMRRERQKSSELDGGGEP